MSELKTESAKRSLANLRDYQAVFLTPEGEKVLKDLMKRFGMLNSTAHDNPYTTYYCEGQRAVILHIIEKLKMNINDVYSVLLKQENSDDIKLP